MNWFAKLERKLGKYAIKNLMLYVIIMYVIGTVIMLYDYTVYYYYLALDPAQILKGQIWRLITFIMMPPASNSIFFIVIMLYVYWSLGTTIENVWGSFRFNVYFFSGVLGNILAAFILYAIYGESASLYTMSIGTEYINFSLFLAYAFTFPDAQFLVFFLIPIKARVLAILELVVYAVLFVTGDLATRIMIGVSLLNVAVFFFMTKKLSRYNPREIKRRREFKKKVGSVPLTANRHRCAVCGKTSGDGENLVFRFCSKCAGNFEYCEEHLYTHIHVTKEDLEKMKMKH